MLVIDTATDTVVHTIQLPVGSGPVAVAVTPDGARVYVTNDNPNTVSVIDTATNTVGPSIAVGAQPQSVAFTPNGAFAYVGNSNSGTVSVIQTSTNSVITTIPVGNVPQEIAITPNGAFAYVSNYYSYDVSVISTNTNSVVATISLGDSPGNLAASPNGAYIYVPLVNSSAVSVVDTGTNAVVASIPVGVHPTTVAFTRNGAFAYVPEEGGGVKVIDTATKAVVVTIPLVGVKAYGVVTVGPKYFVCPLYDSTKAAKSGSTIPVKLQLCDGSRNDLSAATLTVHATSITQISNSISGPVQDAGNANPDSDFRFDSSLGGTGGYVFNLKTAGLSTGTYNLNFTVSGDAAAYATPFQVK